MHDIDDDIDDDDTEDQDGSNDCYACYGSGGGEDAALQCRTCRGTGILRSEVGCEY